MDRMSTKVRCPLGGVLVYYNEFMDGFNNVPWFEDEKKVKAVSKSIIHHIHYNLVSLAGVANGLDCWQCVGDECILEPDKTTIAEKRRCQREESCLVSQG